jgi:glycosyltransferase involved in cell wall biosynthesis
MRQKYSVALASFNGEKYISEQLLSIITQTIPPTQIVVCDDCSTDRTNEIIEQFVTKYNDCKWLHKINNKNLGFTKNFEQAILLCDEEIVFLSDQDDVWIKEKAEIMLHEFKNSKKTILFTDAIITDKQLKPTGTTMFEKVGFNERLQKLFSKKQNAIYLFLNNCIATGATMAFRKDIVRQFMPLPDSSLFIHDSWIATIGACTNNIMYINEPLILYRQHNDQLIGTLPKSDPIDVNCYSSKRQALLEILKIKKSRDSLVYNFFQKNPQLKTKKNFSILEKRNKLYNKILNSTLTGYKRQHITYLANDILLQKHCISSINLR